MTVPPLWPVQVKPHLDETVVTWFARLAWANGCSVDDLLHFIGAERPKTMGVQPKDMKWHTLKPLVEGHVEDFPQRLPDELTEFYTASMQLGGVRGLKVCTLCLQDHGAVTYRMQAVYTLACTEHGVLMRSACSHCGQALRTVLSSVSDIGGCAACGTPYSAMELHPAPSAFLHYQEQLNRESQGRGLDYANFQELAFLFGKTQRFLEIFNSSASWLSASRLHTKPYQQRTAKLFALSNIVGLRADLYSAVKEVFAGEFGYLSGSYGRVGENRALRRQIIALLRQGGHQKAAEPPAPPPQSHDASTD